MKIILNFKKSLAKIGNFLLLFISFILPTNVVFAQAVTSFPTAITKITAYINLTIPFLIGLAVFIIIYGILGYISKAADEEKRAEARNFIIWGVIGVFIMLSIWGLVAILYNSFGLSKTASDLPYEVYNPGNFPPGTTKPSTIFELIQRFNEVGFNVIPFLIIIGFFIVLFGVISYIRHGDNEEKRAEGRMFIIWGVFCITFMLTIWGFVNILYNTFSFANTDSYQPTELLKCLSADGKTLQLCNN